MPRAFAFLSGCTAGLDGMGRFLVCLRSTVLLLFSYFNICLITADIIAAPVNVTVRHLQANSAVVSWEVPNGDAVIGYAISQQRKDVRMLRLIQEVNTTMRSCVLWDLEEDTEYTVHVQSISLTGVSPASEPISFRTPKEAEKLALKDEVTTKMLQRRYTQLRTGEMIIIVVVLVMWAGVIALFCRQYDIIKDNEPNNNKDKAKSSSEYSTPEHPTGGLLRSKFPKNKPSVNIIEA
ncbi:fibronectin type III domain-containing protein 5 [Hypanus sabinus]|uniref:fibronectin type III domain-containing protein 5 n=1 Tax=Hypanus sabinus TaxID=79690 RepID=UPI0028C48ED8|nr:fibronectin type III domain-containing protein 5 [Hypanus sabinus]